MEPCSGHITGTQATQVVLGLFLPAPCCPGSPAGLVEAPGTALSAFFHKILSASPQTIAQLWSGSTPALSGKGSFEMNHVTKRGFFEETIQGEKKVSK